MKDTNFFLGILAIMTLYYLFTRGITEGHTPNLGEKDMDNLKLLPSVQQMQMINQEIHQATQDMAREQVLQKRNVPLFPVPVKTITSKEKISRYLGSINDYMKELAIASDGKLDKEEKEEIIERSHPRGEPTYTQATEQGDYKTNPDWYTDPDGNPYNASNNKKSDLFSQLGKTSQGDMSQFSPKEIYQRRPYNRITPAELKKWFGSTVNVKKEELTNINKNAANKYKK